MHKVEFENVTLWHADCLDVLPLLSGVDAVITDPPYPDIDKDFDQHPIDWMDALKCKQIVFWSAVCPFPLDWTAVHIWHKPNGCSSQHYERIFERNGGKVCRVYRVPIVNSVVAAQMGRDEYYKHPCQKPVKLMGDLVTRHTTPGQMVFEPYAGSGTTAIACIRHGRRFIGVEKDPVHFAAACKRIEQELSQGQLAL